MQNQIRVLRITGISEGISFLVLLLVAMPLKYYAGYPLAVKVVGWMHGILFIAYIAMVFLSINVMRWKWRAVLLALGASLVPLGTFFLDTSLRQREREVVLEAGKLPFSV
jgi:integral membrane protein